MHVRSAPAKDLKPVMYPVKVKFEDFPKTKTNQVHARDEDLICTLTVVSSVWAREMMLGALIHWSFYSQCASWQAPLHAVRAANPRRKHWIQTVKEKIAIRTILIVLSVTSSTIYTFLCATTEKGYRGTSLI